MFPRFKASTYKLRYPLYTPPPKHYSHYRALHREPELKHQTRRPGRSPAGRKGSAEQRPPGSRKMGSKHPQRVHRGSWGS